MRHHACRRRHCHFPTIQRRFADYRFDVVAGARVSVDYDGVVVASVICVDVDCDYGGGEKNDHVKSALWNDLLSGVAGE